MSKGKEFPPKEGKSMTYEGIAARLEEYKTPHSRRLYVDERDVGYLYSHYLEHVQLLLWEVDRLERKCAEHSHLLAEARREGRSEAFEEAIDFYSDQIQMCCDTEQDPGGPTQIIGELKGLAAKAAEGASDEE